jgi:hypothetical protein
VVADKRRIVRELRRIGSRRREGKLPSELGILVVARAGIEPATFRFSGGRSYQLSYLAGRHD